MQLMSLRSEGQRGMQVGFSSSVTQETIWHKVEEKDVPGIPQNIKGLSDLYQVWLFRSFFLGLLFIPGSSSFSERYKGYLQECGSG